MSQSKPPRLGVMVYPGGPNRGKPGLVLVDRDRRAILPNQVSGSLEYGADREAFVTVTFRVEGDRIAMIDSADSAPPESEAEGSAWNSLGAASRAFAALSPDNHRRFLTMYGLQPVPAEPPIVDMRV